MLEEKSGGGRSLMIKKLTFFLMFIFFIAFVYAELEIGNPETEIRGVSLEAFEKGFDNATAFVNSSQFAEIWITNEGNLDNVADINLNDIGDVVLTSPVQWSFLTFVGSNWIDSPLSINTTIDERTRSIQYNATSIVTVEGTLDAGDINSIHVPEDGDTYNVSEGTGANPLIITINYTNVISFDSIIGRISYSGGQGHEVQLEIQRVDTKVWENYFELTDTTDFVNIYVPVFDPQNHVFPSGDVAVRFNHFQNGIPSHDFFIDYLNLVDGFTTLTVADHDSLSRRNDITNHPWAFDILATRNITGNTTFEKNVTIWGDLIITGISYLGALIIKSDNITVNNIITKDGNISFWNGTDKNVVIIQDGDVGIGTSSPDSIFHIKANFPGWVGNNYAGQIIIQNPADSVFSNVVITGYESDGDGNPDQQLWYLGSSSGSTSDIIFLNRRNAKLQLGTSGTSRMTILGNGNVGIGTIAPTHKLNVVGDVNVTGNITSSNLNLAVNKKIKLGLGGQGEIYADTSGDLIIAQLDTIDDILFMAPGPVNNIILQWDGGANKWYMGDSVTWDGTDALLQLETLTVQGTATLDQLITDVISSSGTRVNFDDNIWMGFGTSVSWPGDPRPIISSNSECHLDLAADESVDINSPLLTVTKSAVIIKNLTVSGSGINFPNIKNCNDNSTACSHNDAVQIQMPSGRLCCI